MPFRFAPAWSVSLTELAKLLTRGFSGYFVPLSFTPAAMARQIRLHGVDLDTSLVVLRDDVPVGLALLAHRGWTTRLAMMGIVPEARGTGVGRALLGALLDAGRQRGDRAFVLEVIEANTPAIRLYESAGFTRSRRLVGYHADSPRGDSSRPLEEVDVRQVADALHRHGPSDLPWQVTAETLAQFGPPARGYRLGHAFGAIEFRNERAEILALVVPEDHRHQGEASRLLAGLLELHPDTRWHLFPRFPDDVPARLFTRFGFVLDPIAQWQMTLPLGGGGPA